MTIVASPQHSNAPSHKREAWQIALSNAVRDPQILIERLSLSRSLIEPARQAVRKFPLLVPESFLARMQPGHENDPLLRQVLPTLKETETVAGFSADPVGEFDREVAPGLLQKYHGRALLMTTSACAVHCRYCFRREFPYEGVAGGNLQAAMEHIAYDESMIEAILSGGDPLMLTDSRLEQLMEHLNAIPHVERVRFHTRLPIVLPDRITPRFRDLLTESRAQIVIVVHANHANEIRLDCADMLSALSATMNVTTLNQAVLLRGVNDTTADQVSLSESLFRCGVLPYYLHQLDRVSGSAHFEVPPDDGKAILHDMRARLPGYLVPRFVQEIRGEPAKTPIPCE